MCADVEMNFWLPCATGASHSDFPDPQTKEMRFRTRVTEVAGVRWWVPEAEQAVHAVDADAEHPTTLPSPILLRVGTLARVEIHQTLSARALGLCCPIRGHSLLYFN